MEKVNEYVLKVFTKKSFSKAAEELYISQPSLSITIKKLERSLGFEIFNRATTPLHLTPEGEIYIEYLREYITNENNMKNKIKNLYTPSKKSLFLASTSYASNKIAPVVCSALHKKYPDLEIVLDSGMSLSYKQLTEKLANWEFDLMFGYSYNKDIFSCVVLQKEFFFIATKKDYVQNNKLFDYALTYSDIISDNISQEKNITDYSVFLNLKFLGGGRLHGIQEYIYDIVKNANLSPCALNNSTLDVQYQMMLNDMGAVITTDFFIKNNPENKDVVYFALSYPNFFRELKIIYKKGKTPSKIENEFINLTLDALRNQKNNALY